MTAWIAAGVVLRLPSAPTWTNSTMGEFHEVDGFDLFAAAGTAQRDDRSGTVTQPMRNQMRADERLHHACCDHWLVPFSKWLKVNLN
ncbi:hypothetical protein QYH69_05050 [Paraburkholderia sp. SARCC-3016]|uniref:hypothetical protein n=1 Tax=Paraburkholderia sp. SARCC-3016 TaxID=3058611 RepID=UPI00280766F7|nr:hypothetical protein [Paraburkholderia sp. SARCC-3016]MDQ7976609.1 hypothetical protein [Paraburkholderia sp. SARCC-3016]